MEKLKEYKGYIILIVGIIGLVLVNYDTWFKDAKVNQEINASEYAEVLITTTETPSNDDSIVVEIKGEVLYPGIYEVSEGLRVGDIIRIAGGLKPSADISKINQAAKVIDEMVIYVPIETITTTETTVDSSLVRIIVEIKGAVMYPGVYTMYKNQRVYELIEEAGGFLDTADNSTLDLARILSDGETVIIHEIEAEEIEEVEEPRYIYVEIAGEIINPGVYLVPENYSVKDLIYEAGGVTVNCDLSSINWNVTLCLGAVIYIPSYDDEVEVEEDTSGLININTANLETLIELPGIGNILGQRIIDYRAEYGDFLSIEDIMNVSGIKESVYEQVKDLITV